MSGSKFVDKSAEYTSVRVGKQLVKLHNTSVVGRLFKVQNNAFSLCTITETSSVSQVSYSVHVILYSKKHIKSFDPHICYIVIFVIGILLYITTIYSLLMLFMYFVIITDVAKL